MLHDVHCNAHVYPTIVTGVGVSQYLGAASSAAYISGSQVSTGVRRDTKYYKLCWHHKVKRSCCGGVV